MVKFPESVGVKREVRFSSVLIEAFNTDIAANIFEYINGLGRGINRRFINVSDDIAISQTQTGDISCTYIYQNEHLR